MPLSLVISHEQRRVTAVIDGTVGVIEGLKALAQIFAAGAVPYGKLIDFSFARPEEGAKAIRQLANFTAHANKGRKPGPLAIVAKSELLREMALMFDRQVKADRPFKIFEDAASAAAWLDELSGPVSAELAS